MNETSRPPRRRRLSRRALLAVAGGLVVVLIAGLAVIYFLVFPTSSPKPFALTTAKVATPVSAGTRMTGTWKIAAGSEAGYRVREKLGFLPAQSDAVGRTSQISGQAALSESAARAVTISSASFRVAVNTLKSDRSMRDARIHTSGLESDTYPTASFVLSKPIKLPASALSGRVVHTTVTGVFNIHGTARRETLPLELTLSASSIRAVGSLTFPWSTFNMTAPSVAGFVNVSDRATMEFDLRLARA